MRSSLTPPSRRTWRLGARLLLTLALCACGGSDGADDSPEAGSADAAAASASQAAGPAPCAAPPVVADTTVFTGPWAAFSGHLAKIGARFAEPADSSTAPVRFCQNCRSAQVQIISEAATYCTTPAQMDSGGARILAVMVLRSDYPGDPEQGWQPIPANDSIFMFASSTDGPATLVYRGDQGKNAVVAPESSWTFYYCRDRHPRPARAQAKWRSRGKPAQDDDDGGGGAYGWMACASGCCQFYTPPPNEGETSLTTPPRANPNAPDAVGRGWGRPPWCPADSAGAP